jgi:hypothetical protein
VRTSYVFISDRIRTTDLHGRVASDARRLADEAGYLANCMRRLGRVGDALDDFRNGAFLTVRQAAIICEVSDQTIYDWITDASRLGRPIAEKQATWVIGTERLPMSRSGAVVRLRVLRPKRD